jgi:hypothetical protein
MGKATPKKKTANTLNVADRREENKATVKAAATIHHVARANFRELDLDGLLSSLRNQVEQANKGNLNRPEALLVGQTHTLMLSLTP